MSTVATIWRSVVCLHTRTQWYGIALFGVLALVFLPVCSLLFPEDSSLHIPNYLIALLGKFTCFAIVAIALDLLWGYCGILSLGHGVFFAFGAYIMGMHMLCASSGSGVYRSALPDFMVFLDWKEMPWYWSGFHSPLYTILMILLVPGLASFLFGYFAFRSRIRGVYFSIMTQAMTYAMMLLFFRNETGFGGENGLTDFKQFFGMPLQQSATKVILLLLSVSALFTAYLTARFVVRSRTGLVLRAIRDAEATVCFQGYDTAHFKLFVWVLSAVMCAIAGALYVPQVGIINPSEMEPAKSVDMAIWVALGGCGTLIGAIIGAFLVNTLRSVCTVWCPEFWLFILGSIFIGSTVWLPGGIVDVVAAVRRTRHRSILRAIRTKQRLQTFWRSR